MHWADVIAEDLFKHNIPHVLATGITPSGPIHLGNMREILTTDAIYRCLIEKGGDAEFIYIADDFDPLRKVYPYLPESYEKYVGMPISDIPCPCGKHQSYADHYLYSFLNSLKEIGVQPHIYRAHEMYKKGEYNEAIRIALDNTEKIRQILENISKRQIPKNWLPFNILCTRCKRMTKSTPILYEYPIIEYKCTCGYEGEVDIRQGGVGKLPWRVDWPARWKMLKVTFEPCGKDLATVGGARDTGAHIVEEVYNYPPPALVVYEFILLKGQGAMHSSKGTALSSDQMLQMTPPKVLRFLLMKQQPNKHIVFDTGLGLLNLVDEYDKIERTYFGIEDEIKGMKDLEKTYELSQPHTIPKKLPYHLPYRHLVTLIQIADTWNDIKKILKRTNQLTTTLSPDDENRMKQRCDHVHYWLKHYAPDAVKFKVQPHLPKINIDEQQHQFLTHLYSTLPETKWIPEDIHNIIYTISEQHQIPIKRAFTTLYQILLGQTNGPRAGYFLSNLDKTFITQRIAEALK
ncbi:MAG: lysine--tRNA ligase [Candidatus Thermoplasmatota archaeon]|nr:lysine--tRNA ligase [Candidatus Thermoplasmatota archaeon]MBU1941067.1 lysine--tRNA ligase [Candidatus Thermoplasmatota archaeon]